MSYDGLLNITCTIQKNTTTQDSTTYEITDSWATFASSVKCRLTGARGGEQRSSNDILNKMTHKLFLVYRTDIDWKDYQIVIGSNTYNILIVIDAGGAGRHTELALEIVK